MNKSPKQKLDEYIDKKIRLILESISNRTKSFIITLDKSEYESSKFQELKKYAKDKYGFIFHVRGRKSDRSELKPPYKDVPLSVAERFAIYIKTKIDATFDTYEEKFEDFEKKCSDVKKYAEKLFGRSEGENDEQNVEQELAEVDMRNKPKNPAYFDAKLISNKLGGESIELDHQTGNAPATNMWLFISDLLRKGKEVQLKVEIFHVS
jgi:hypothetical protein